MLTRSLADAEPREQRVENVLDANGAGNAPQRAERKAEVFRTEFRQVGCLGASKTCYGVLKRGAMARLGQWWRPAAFSQRSRNVGETGAKGVEAFARKGTDANRIVRYNSTKVGLVRD